MGTHGRSTPISAGVNVFTKLIKENELSATNHTKNFRTNRTVSSRRPGSMSFSKKESKFAQWAAPLLAKIASKGFSQKQRSSVKSRRAIPETHSYRDKPHFDFANECLKGRETPRILVTALPIDGDIPRSEEKPIK